MPLSNKTKEAVIRNDTDGDFTINGEYKLKYNNK